MTPRSVAIDIVEENIRDMSPSLLRALLKDKSTGKNILWATDDYKETFGPSFENDCQITEKLITGKYWNIIQPRTAKQKELQDDRTKNHAEVFTPSWICNHQNNLIDEQWFGRKDVFNEERGQEWITYHEKISFPDGKDWKGYVDAKRIEVACGEAPYLVSRYDAASGERITLNRRIGILDRKFRIVNENASSTEEWLKWSIRALQSVYAYEFQGDNVLLARENILFTFIDNYKAWVKEDPDIKTLLTVINIITWNIWQMDGISCLTPYAVAEPPSDQQSLFDILATTSKNAKQPYCVLMDWRKKKKYLFKDLIERSK